MTANPNPGQLLNLDGRVAIVTGGATGIGEGIARLLADAGALVVVADIEDDGAKQVSDEIATAGGDSVPAHMDVTDPEAAADLVAQVARDHGRLDILVNNAGSYHEAGSILDQSVESWRRALDINLASLFHCSKPAATRLVEQGSGGAIVNIASVDGYLPCLGTGYDSAKAGVIHFTRSLALDLAPHQIRVNAIAPGHIAVRTLERMSSGDLPPVWPGAAHATGLMGPLMRQRSANIPLGRSGTPADIARAVLFLVSDAASYVTGHTLVVDGGWLLT